MKKKREKGLIKEIKEIAVKIYDTLGSGFTEEVYQKAFEVEFRLRGIKYEAQNQSSSFMKDTV